MNCDETFCHCQWPSQLRIGHAALASIGVDPDFSYTKPQPDSELLFVHRRLNDGDVYFVNNRKDRAEHFDVRFRVTGKLPEIWRADTGTLRPSGLMGPVQLMTLASKASK